jgi:ribosomal protein S18 acetylase RimI-like enzyme
MPDDFLDNQNAEARRIEWLQNMREYPGNLLIVEDGSAGVLGFSCTGPVTNLEMNRFDGQIFGIHVALDAKRRGYGLQLMISSFERLALFGCRNAMLWTLEENAPARLFYEKLGGQIVDRKLIMLGGKELAEIAYSWDALVLQNGDQR